MNEIIIAAHNVRKQYDEGEIKATVLRGVELKVKAAERIAIVGASGSGKSTLLHVLGGLDTPSQGEVFVCGKDIHQMNAAEQGRWRNQCLGFVYQFHHLLPEFTALENVAMPLLIAGVSIDEARSRAAKLLNDVQLSKREKHKPGELSGGERQRVAMARALVTQPKCVLADEPTGNLDSRTADHVYELMLTLNTLHGTSFIVVTHDERLAQKMDLTYHLTDGSLQT